MSVPPAKRIFEFNKAVIVVSLDTGRAVAEAVTDGAGKAWKTMRDSGATVAGQARAAVDRTADDATTESSRSLVRPVPRARSRVDNSPTSSIAPRRKLRPRSTPDRGRARRTRTGRAPSCTSGPRSSTSTDARRCRSRS